MNTLTVYLIVSAASGLTTAIFIQSIFMLFGMGLEVETFIAISIASGMLCLLALFTINAAEDDDCDHY